MEPPPLPLITIDTVTDGIKTAEYLIEIPWGKVYPFNPLKDEKAGINIIYIKKNGDGPRTILMLTEDNNYDTELTNFRKFIPVKFKFSPKSGLNITGKLQDKVIDGKKTKAEIWIRSPKSKKTRFTLEVKSETDSVISRKNFTKTLTPGSNHFFQTINLPKYYGLVRINVSVNDSAAWEDALIKYRAQRLKETPEVIKLLSRTSHNKFIDFGCEVITYHIQKINEEIKSFDERKDVYLLNEKLKNLDTLIVLLTTEKNVLKRSGYIECAFRAVIDSSLQPFSLILPVNFDPIRKYDLLLALHGSGVDEKEMIKNAAKNFSNENLIIAAPRGRDLSSWYNGITEKDIVDLTQYLKILFRLDKIYLYGFSMGGYGVWRFGLLYPELFSGGIVISGIPFNPAADIPEYNMENYLNHEKKLSYLVIHGTDDNSLNINHTDAFVDKLKRMGFKIDYIRIEGGGHGNFNSIEFIKNWLKKFDE